MEAGSLNKESDWLPLMSSESLFKRTERGTSILGFSVCMCFVNNVMATFIGNN